MRTKPRGGVIVEPRAAKNLKNLPIRVLKHGPLYYKIFHKMCFACFLVNPVGICSKQYNLKPLKFQNNNNN